MGESVNEAINQKTKSCRIHNQLVIPKNITQILHNPSAYVLHDFENLLLAIA